MNKFRLSEWRTPVIIALTLGLSLAIIGLMVVFIANNFKPTHEVRIGSGVYSLVLADTEAKRVQGLSGVSNLAPNEGLLMKFDTDAQHGIWMKDMLIPLDIIWLDSNKKVIYIVKNAQPEDPISTIYAPEENARYVIELPARSADRSGIKNGNTAKFDIDV